MSAGHTQGRMTWKRRPDGSMFYVIGDHKAGPHAQGDIYIDEADLQRLAACWNYCDGVSTLTLELAVSINRPIQTFINESIKRELELTAQRDHLLVLMVKLMDTELAELACKGSDAPVEDLLGRIQEAIAAIAKAEGGAA